MDLDRLREILDTMRRNRLRTALTAVGVFWGVMLLIVMVGFGNGLQSGAKRSMGGLATNSLYLWGQRTSVPYEGLSPGRSVMLTLDDANAVARVPGVRVAAPRVSLGGRQAVQPVVRGSKSGTFQVMGDTPSYLEIEPLVLRGRFVNALDMKQRRKVAVIGERVQKELFGQDDPIGQGLSITGVDFMVVGVFTTTQTGDRGDRHAGTIYTPLTTFQKALSASPNINYIAVLSEPGTAASEVEEQLGAVLRKRHRAAPGDKLAVGSFNADAEFRKIVSLFLGIEVLIFVVAGATLVAGLVGVSNIMMVSVRERTREIGIRKAIGATPRAVVTQIVLESVMLASVAGYLGLVVGVGLLEAIAPLVSGDPKSTLDPPQVTLATAAGAAVAVALGGGLAGLFPALHAARIRTVLAIREQ